MADSIVTLLFMAVWLTGWSAGVGVIQSMVLQGDLAVLLFLFTHGGAEVGILIALARSLIANAKKGGSLPALELEHDGVRATWRAGTPSVLKGIIALPIGVLAHALVIGGVVHGLANVDGPLLIGLGVALLVLWAATAVLWAYALLLQFRGAAVVELDADLDGVRLEVNGRETRFGLEDLRVDTFEDTLGLSSGEQSVDVPCVASMERRELVKLLQMMAGREDDRTEMPVPEGLASLRGERA